MTDPEDSFAIEAFFKAGISVEDLPALFPLLRAREAVQALITLFRGGNEEVLVRLMVLREIGSRGDLPRWSPQQLRQHFAYFDPTKLETVLGRLSANHLLTWDSESGEWQVSPHGRMALAALTGLLKFSEEGGELGYITAQLAASSSVDRVSAEQLQHLLARLTELQIMFDRAVISGSEHRIRQAAQKLEAVYGWVEKGTEVMRIIAADADLDTAAHQVAHRIGHA